MVGWEAKKFQLPNHNFETIAIKFESGRVGLCYHGSTIWKDEGGGWEDFIAADWKTVWKEGRPCSFKDLPPDMRIACPVCGAKIQADDRECGQCGIIFDKMKEVPEEPGQPDVPEEPEETRRSKMVDFSLAGVILIVAALILYTTVFKPPAPEQAPKTERPAAEEVADIPQDDSFNSPDVYRYSPPEPADSGYATDGESVPEVPEEVEEEITVREKDYYRYINLDDPDTAHRQLMEAAQELNQEATKISNAFSSASTAEEKRQAQIDKIIYEQKSRQLSGLVQAFNARNKNDE